MHKGRVPTRREFLLQLGLAGGCVFSAMTALELLAAPSPARPPLPNGDRGRGKRVLVLGAGLAGLSAAYELGKLGYDCRLLEARDRTGGRCWTARGGTRETEVGGETQTCRFDEGQFLNCGPMRIPAHHTSTLNYCKELGVAVEVFPNVNEAAYLHIEGGPKMRVREVRADYRGYTSELLAKALDHRAIDLPLSREDRERLRSFLHAEGDLAGRQLEYRGSYRRGYKNWPGVAPGVLTEPAGLETLLRSGLGEMLPDYYGPEQQATMFTVAGGLDRLAAAFRQRLEPRITLQAEVREIRKSADGGVRVVYAGAHDEIHEATGDYCICTIPLPVLKSIPADFSKPFAAAIRSGQYLAAAKIGLQFKRRFWEEDDRIFGGVTRTTQTITQIVYPSDRLNSGGKGVLTGCFNFGRGAELIGELTSGKREELALREGMEIHPQYRAEFEKSFSVAWQKVPYSLGGWALWNEESRATAYRVLTEPDGPIYLAGDHLSYLSGWMQGAFESAQLAVKRVHQAVHSA